MTAPEFALGTLTLITAAVFVALTAFGLAHRPVLAVIALIASHITGTEFDLPFAYVGPLALSAADAVNVVVLASALIRFRTFTPATWAGLGMCAAVLAAVASALFTFGDAALLGFRAELFFLTPIVLLSTMRSSDVQDSVNALGTLGALAGTLALLRWVFVPLGIELGGIYDAPSGIPRVVAAPTALLISAAGIAHAARFLLGNSRSPTNRHALLAAASFAIVFAAQHRSVWLASIGAIVVLLLRAPRSRRPHALAAAIAVAFLAGIITLMNLESDPTNGAPIYATNTQTWLWRLERWEQVWTTHVARGPGAVLVGSGYGRAWVSGEVGVWEVSPHNAYLTYAIRFGVIGFLVLGWLHIWSLRRVARQAGVQASALLAINLGALLFYIPYSGTPLTGVAIGLAAALARGGTQERRKRRSSRPVSAQ